MASPARRKGTRREYMSMRVLERLGYRCIRSAASLGCWDIVAIGSHDVLLVQVKSRDWPGTAEVQTLMEFPAPPGVHKMIHRWRDHQRLPDVKEV